MKKENFTQLLLLIIFIIFSYLFYIAPVFLPVLDKMYITITTFFFSIFTGFFISQQMSRYSKIRETISHFDGKMSSIYRSAENINKNLQEKIGEIIKGHYKKMIMTEEWNYHLVHKSNTISNIHGILEEDLKEGNDTVLPSHAVGVILANLSDCEVSRKTMVMLYQERIPSFQWFVIYFFMGTFILTISSIPSHSFIFESILKSAFIVSLFSVASILHHLDHLHLFEDFIGQNSAQDVVDLIEKRK